MFLIRLSFSREHAALISVTEVNKPQKSKLIKKITIRKPIAALVIAAILLTVGCISNKTERKLISTKSYWTPGECCTVNINKWASADKATEYSVDYLNSQEGSTISLECSRSQVDSIAEERVYYCEFNHEAVPFIYKVEQ